MNRPKIMGVVNTTPDSFSDGGKFTELDMAVSHALKLVSDGADILDIGGESTRPGADVVSVEEEKDRVLPLVEVLAERNVAPLSVDTRKPEIAVTAVKAGASIWNDVSALTFSGESLSVATDLSCDIILMHASGDPKTMQNNPSYDDVVEDVYAFLAERIEACVQNGIVEDRLIIDPGIGFGKTLGHNLDLLAHLDRFQALGRPVLLGASRKRFIEAIDRESPADQRVGGSIAAVLSGALRGADIFRVHDVAETRQALGVFNAIENAANP